MEHYHTNDSRAFGLRRLSGIGLTNDNDFYAAEADKAIAGQTTSLSSQAGINSLITSGTITSVANTTANTINTIATASTAEDRAREAEAEAKLAELQASSARTETSTGLQILGMSPTMAIGVGVGAIAVVALLIYSLSGDDEPVTRNTKKQGLQGIKGYKPKKGAKVAYC